MSQRIRRAIFASFCAALLCACWLGRAAGSGFSGGPGSTGVPTFPLVAPTGLGAVAQFQGPTDQTATFAAGTARDLAMNSKTNFLHLQLQGAEACSLWQKSLGNNTTTSIVSFTFQSPSMVSGQLLYTANVTNGTDAQTESGYVNFGYVNKAGTVTAATITKIGNAQALTSAATLVVTFTNLTGASSSSIQCNMNSSLSSITTESVSFEFVSPWSAFPTSVTLN